VVDERFVNGEGKASVSRKSLWRLQAHYWWQWCWESLTLREFSEERKFWWMFDVIVTTAVRYVVVGLQEAGAVICALMSSMVVINRKCSQQMASKPIRSHSRYADW